MLFYDDPFRSKRFEKVAEWRGEVEGDRSHIRLMYNREDKTVTLFQEVYCCGHMRNSSIELQAATAVAMFPNYGARINELLVEPYTPPADPYADY